LGLVQLGANQLVLTNANGTFGGTIADGGIYGGGGGSLVLAGGKETLTGVNTYTGGTIVLAGTLQLFGAGTLGASTGTATLFGGVLDLGQTTQTLAALFLSGGALQNGNLNAPIVSTGGTINGIGGTASLTTFSGMTFAFGTNTYTGGTIVNGGVLDVIGSLTDPTVNSGGTLSGTGTVGATTVDNGGVLAPGNPTGILTVQGNLVFASAASYLIQIGPVGAGRTNVVGTATLGGTVIVAPLPNGIITHQYDILNATAGLNNSFLGVVAPNYVALNPTLTYGPNDVFLNLSLNYNSLGNLNGNQQAVGNALTNFFNSAGFIPAVFAGLTAQGLQQIAGEASTGALQTTFQAMNTFINTLLDPFIDGRTGNGAQQSRVTPYADDDAAAYAAKSGARSSSERDAYAMARKAPFLNTAYDPRWSVWASGFGGSETTDGNAVAGTNTMSSRIYGTAVGADYLISPRSLVGFAMAGGGTNYSVNNFGTGRSDLFQAGAFVRHNVGHAYVSAALAYGWQNVSTDRVVTAAGFDHLQANFNASAVTGRIEGGYRFVAPLFGGVGITPYAAGQFTTFFLPAYAEQAVVGTNLFAQSYPSQNVTDSRSELGVRTDKSFALSTGILTLRGRFAWAHDFDPNRAVSATFQTLPGASFVVNGAAMAPDSALTTASAEMKWLNGWSAAATVEGEFSSVTSSYTGKGVVRYTW
jgi:autotransporter-associated beta strand protein